MFETFVSKVPAEKAQRVYRFFYEYEAHYGDLAQVYKLEKRMAELYPADQKLEQFSTRYAYHAVDPCKYLPVISPAQQAKQKPLLPLPPEAAAAAVGLPIPSPPIPQPIPGTSFHPPPPPSMPPRTSSPKRAATEDDGEYSSRARKLPRSDSPVPTLKGAAGRRLNQIKQQQAAAAAAANQSQPKDNNTGGGAGGRREYANAPVRRDNNTSSSNIPPLPEAIWYLLSILPGADKYQAARFRPEAMVALLAGVQLPRPEDLARGCGGGGGYYDGN